FVEALGVEADEREGRPVGRLGALRAFGALGLGRRPVGPGGLIRAPGRHLELAARLEAAAADLAAGLEASSAARGARAAPEAAAEAAATTEAAAEAAAAPAVAPAAQHAADEAAQDAADDVAGEVLAEALPLLAAALRVAPAAPHGAAPEAARAEVGVAAGAREHALLAEQAPERLGGEQPRQELRQGGGHHALVLEGRVGGVHAGTREVGAQLLELGEALAVLRRALLHLGRGAGELLPLAGQVAQARHDDVVVGGGGGERLRAQHLERRLLELVAQQRHGLAVVVVGALGER